MGENSNAKRLKKNQRKNLGGESLKQVDKSDPGYIAAVNAARAERKQKGLVFKPVHGGKPVQTARNPQRKSRKSGKTPKIISSNPASAVSTSTTVDEFLELRNIVNKLNSGLALSDQDVVRLGHMDPWKIPNFIRTNNLSDDVAERLTSEAFDASNIRTINRSTRLSKKASSDPFGVQLAREVLEKRRLRYESGEDRFTAKMARKSKEEAWLDQTFNRNRNQRKISNRVVDSPAKPNTIQAADEELAFFRRDVGYVKGAKSVYQARVSRQLADLKEEINFLDDNFNYNFLNNPKGHVETRITEIGKRREYLEKQLRSRTTMMDINPIYARHMKLIKEAEAIGVDVSDLGIKSRT